MLTNNYPFQKNSVFKHRISMIKAAKLSFFLTSNSEGHGSHGNKGTIFILGSVNVSMSVISKSFILLKSVDYIESYRYLSALC